MTFVFSDKDKDIKSYCLTIKDADTLTVIMPEAEYTLEQTEETHYQYTAVDYTDVNSSTP